MLAYILSKLVTLTYGLMYPAYCSFKAVKTKDVREYVNWMMYWIAFAVFSVVEVFADTFIGCWFPFYYEGKILFLLWMISSSTRGGAILYRKYIHPALLSHEEEIDACLADFKAKASGALMKWGYKALTSVSEIVMAATFRAGDPMLDNFRRTCSMNDLNRGYPQRYLGAPPGPGSRDFVDGYPHPALGSEIYFERNVPVQDLVGDDMGDVDLSDNNSDRRMGRDRRPAAVLMSQDAQSHDGGDSDTSDSRRLRSSTRKRNIERIIVDQYGRRSSISIGSETGERQRQPIQVIYGWYPTHGSPSPPLLSSPYPNSIPVSFNQDSSLSSQNMVVNEEVEIEEIFGDEKELESGDEFYECDVHEDVEVDKSEERVVEEEVQNACESGNEPRAEVVEGVESIPKKVQLKTVGKTVLQGFEPPSVSSGQTPEGSLGRKKESPKSYSAPKPPPTNKTTVEALTGDPLNVISSVPTPGIAKEVVRQRVSVPKLSENSNMVRLKQSSSFAGRTTYDEKDKHSKGSLSWHPSSFRRVFHSFNPSKTDLNSNSGPSPSPASPPSTSTSGICSITDMESSVQPKDKQKT